MRILFTGLLMVYALMVGVFIWRCYRKGVMIRLATKTAASVLFVVVGLLFSLRMGADQTDYGMLVLTGLCLGLLGDVALECQHVFPAKKDVLFVTGLGFFLLGHVLYILAFMRLTPWTWVQPVVALLTVALGLVLVRVLRIAPGKMRIPVYAYLLIIALMLGGAVGVFVAGHGLRGTVLLLAAASFVVSDGILAYIQFGPKKIPLLTGLNLGTYYLAQILLALSIGIL